MCNQVIVMLELNVRGKRGYCGGLSVLGGHGVTENRVKMLFPPLPPSHFFQKGLVKFFK